MIKLFRKIRQKLLIENKFRNYLVYAIGEMILVVIGILIALSINNWNNDNQKREREIFYLGGIKNNLIANLNNQILPAIEELEKTTESHKKLESYFFHSSDKINQDSVRWLIYDVNVGWNLILNTVAFENLNSIGVDLISNDTLRNQITNLYGYEFTNLANQQSITQKYFADRVQPVFNSVIGLWSR
ncbi:MAG: hypothetical protein HKN67_11015, partial [Saprospiraceae bacterium]|nr:hypothetical protein [Saprospiraceae bacterium]